jgi:hypothetical protein
LTGHWDRYIYAAVAIKARLAGAGQIESAREVTVYQKMISDFREAARKTSKLWPLRDHLGEPMESP